MASTTTDPAEILRRRIRDVFAMPGWSVTTKLVDRVDNQGEPCEVCQTDPHYIDATVYGVELGTHDQLDKVAVECCILCVPSAIKGMDPTVGVTVELGDSLDDDPREPEYDDRMHSQDCGCWHPDAL